MFYYTRNLDPAAVGKSVAGLYSKSWDVAQANPIDLIQWAFVEGRTFIPGVFDVETPLGSDEKTIRSTSRWIGNDIIVIDIDEPGDYTYDDILDDPYIREHALAVFPSSSFTLELPKAHVVFQFDKRISDVNQFKRIGRFIGHSVGVETVDPTTLQPIQPIFGTRFNRLPDQTYTLDHPLIRVNVNAKPVDTLGALTWFVQYHADEIQRPMPHRDTMEGDESLSKRIEAHYNAPPEKQLSVTLEALSWALKGDWGQRPRDERLPLVMAAFAACDDDAVRDKFLDYSSPVWDESNQKQTLPAWWATHSPREGGYTVATLFYLAREQGWLSTSTVDLKRYDTIHVTEIADWLNVDNVPNRLLLKSGTGTGKTKAAIELLKQLRPRKSLFFAPSIKLCIALSAALDAAGVENTLYIDTGRYKTKDGDTLRQASNLVTTLQTFAIKVAKAGVDIEAYELVVIDESDELISAFSRAGVYGKVVFPSHVSRSQARHGMDTLRRVFDKCKYVLLLDGTATQVSQYVLDAFSNQPIQTYVNTWKRQKAPVMMIPDIRDIRAGIVKAVKKGHRVVVATDTKDEAALIDILLRIEDACPPEDVIRITGDTNGDERVTEFFRDVEQGARDYRVVIYNTAMGSGVSIETVKPDALYMIASYLAPRKLIQLVNRYRQQERVFAYVAPRESIYSESITDRYQQFVRTTVHEQTLSTLDLKERDDIADVVTQTALLAATDEFDQQRSVQDFMAALFREDGREVTWFRGGSSSEETDKRVKLARNLLNDKRDEIRADWRSVPPITSEHPAPDGLTLDEIAKGVLHGAIAEELENYAPNAMGLSDSDMAKLVLRFKNFKWTLDKLFRPETILSHTVNELYDRRRERITFRLYLSRVEIINTVGHLFPDATVSYSDRDIQKNVSRFLGEIDKRQDIYNMISTTHMAYDNVLDRYSSDSERAVALAGSVLKSVGLRLKRKNGKRIEGTEQRERVWYIDGVDQLYTYLTLRGGFSGKDGEPEPIIQFDPERFSEFTKTARKTIKTFKRLPDSEQRSVVETLRAMEKITFDDAVAIAAGRMFDA